MPAKKDTIRFEAVDLKGALKALEAQGRDISPESKKVLKAGMSLIAFDARSSMRSRTGGGTYPKDAAQHVSQRGTKINLKRGSANTGYGFGAEFGSNWVFVPTRSGGHSFFPAAQAKGRQFAPFGGSGFVLRGRTTGYHIGPAMLKHEPLIAVKLNQAITEMIVNTNNRNGVRSVAA